MTIANNGDIAMDGNTFFLNESANRIGIGQNNPLDRLHLTGGNMRIENSLGEINFYQGATHGASIRSNATNFFLENKNAGEIRLITGGQSRLIVKNSGQVGIGTNPVPATGYALSVDGKIIGEELKVQMSQFWPDYVFDEGYKMLSLHELEKHINQYRHLPGIPSATAIKEANGFEVGEMNRLLLEKIEELTLYVIDLQKQIDTLNGKN
jgi:hypothetical protein